MSGKQRKAELQAKRAMKRGDIPQETTSSSHRSSNTSRRGGDSRRGKQPSRANVDASRRLESSFVKFSPDFLEEAKRKASSLLIARPIPPERILFPSPWKTGASNPVASAGDDQGRRQELTVLRRPKWRYDMSKKEVESNEAGVFKKWLEDTDQLVNAWINERSEEDKELVEHTDGKTRHPDNSECMPHAAPLFERNLEVWRQLSVLFRLLYFFVAE